MSMQLEERLAASTEEQEREQSFYYKTIICVCMYRQKLFCIAILHLQFMYCIRIR